jgi:hypothetical protein
MDDKAGSRMTFESLENSFPSFFQLPVRHDISLEFLLEFKQTIFVHIIDHIHKWDGRRSICKADTPPPQQ